MKLNLDWKFPDPPTIENHWWRTTNVIWGEDIDLRPGHRYEVWLSEDGFYKACWKTPTTIENSPREYQNLGDGLMSCEWHYQGEGWIV